MKLRSVRRVIAGPLAVVTACAIAGSVGPLPGAGPSGASPPAGPHNPVEAPPRKAAPVIFMHPGDEHDQATAASAGSPLSWTGGTGAIPEVALAAYRRAAAVMDTAAPACRLPWTLLAAIGRVESDHGRHGGSVLDPDGVVRPALVGPVLDGHGNVAAVPDTDAGALDGNRRWDRAVGPMQFLPGTWRVVAVDGDGDGVRNPQDIDDAALAAAVYLCSGGDRLDRHAGAARAVFRYNHSHQYVDLVLRLADSYRDAAESFPEPVLSGNLTATAHTLSPTILHARHLSGPASAGNRPDRPARADKHPAKPHTGAPATADGPIGRPTDGSSDAPGDPATEPTDPADPTQPADPTEPADPPSGSPTDPPSTEPTDPPPTEPTDPPPTEPTEPVLTTLTGTWTACPPDGTTDPAADPAYCLDGQRLDLGTAEEAALPAAADIDGDDTPETQAEEFAGLVGQQVTVGVEQPAEEGAAPVVRVINGVALAAGEGTDAPASGGS